MSIRSVDLQMLVPKTQEQSRVNQQDNDKIRVQHQQVVQEDKKTTEVHQSRVNTFDNKNTIYNQEKNPQKRENGKKKKDKKDSNGKKDRSKVAQAQLGSKLDIKI